VYWARPVPGEDPHVGGMQVRTDGTASVFFGIVQPPKSPEPQAPGRRIPMRPCTRCLAWLAWMKPHRRIPRLPFARTAKHFDRATPRYIVANHGSPSYRSNVS
jgi:hypothetical protein